ncbi:2Fe-2S ferredoxin-type domain-containing protein [Glomus cerebriforme]|uniref:2Fe-2S ferredoxin-type domain-containing protein n=1 Tax=Glomus cerebriforme TaxID=658196 RepID=A0A397TEH7_9GLOM|nr:2Fe-2S ferredoxin-type domain-containing protein [Glomus cerebriforme]
MFSRFLQQLNTKRITSLSNSFLNNNKRQQIMYINNFVRQNSRNKIIFNNILKTTKNKFVPITMIDQFRNFSNSKVFCHKEITPPKEGEGVTINFITPEGEKITKVANVGDSIMDITQAHDIDLECACEGSLACSTCHVIVDPKYYDKLEEPTDEENDMLDLAFGLTETSRLGCQIVMRKDLDGITVTIPSATRNVKFEGKKIS